MPGSSRTYTVGWICALQVELEASYLFFEEDHGLPQAKAPNDDNTYMLGSISSHNVVMAVLPAGEYGTASAESVAKDMLRSFPDIRFGLMVGIGGGAPSEQHDIRLGDVVVSQPGSNHGGVVQYDYGKKIQGREFQSTAHLDKPPRSLRTALQVLSTHYNRDGNRLDAQVTQVLAKYPRLRKKYSRPATADVLYASDVLHPEEAPPGSRCDQVCAEGRVVGRQARNLEIDNISKVHYGLIASGNTLLKDASNRDWYAEHKGVLCFEMEAAGLMNSSFKCLVIRGICDYCDTHKNKDWQGYAAMVAAAYASDLLHRIPPSDVQSESRMDVEGILESIQGDVAEVKQAAQRIRANQVNQQDREVLNWLTKTNYGSQQSDFLAQHQEGTGQWLLDHPKFKYWEHKGATLFCPGMPGAGKTIITSVVIQHLTTLYRGDQTVGIAYLFCSFRQKGTQKIEHLLSSLAKQLAEHRTALHKDIQQLYNNHQRHTRPSLQEVKGLLQSVVLQFERVYVLVDGLDECDDSARKELLQEIFHLRTKTEVNIFATSRFIREVENYFEGIPTVEVRASDSDVRKFLDGEMQKKPSLNRWNSETRDNIKEKIAAAVDGMFILARIYLGAFEDLVTERDVSEALQQLHRLESGATENDKISLLQKAYDGAMDRISLQPPKIRQLAKNSLTWIAFAKRPLSPKELCHALAIEAAAEAGDHSFDVKTIPDIAIVVSSCAGLVTVDERSRIVRLAHYTTQEYFELTKQEWLQDPHSHIVERCCTYFLFDDFKVGVCRNKEEFDTRLEFYGFYSYAARNWGLHASQAVQVPQNVVSFLVSQPHFKATMEASGVFLEKRKTTNLQAAAFFGLQEVVQQLLAKGADVNAEGGEYGTALVAAAEGGHKEVVQQLLAEGADVNAEGGEYGTALAAAAGEGHKEVVQQLLAEGADVNAKGRKYETALTAAARGGYKEVVQQLLAEGADVNAEGGFYETALAGAAGGGHKEVVQQLLAEGADVNAEGREYGTALVAAAGGGYKEVVQQLLAEGADVNAEGRFYGTALTAAAGGGHKEVVQQLLAEGADVNAEGREYGTALAAAAREGHKVVVQQLLAEGADVNAEGGEYGTALTAAARGGYKEVVQQLLAEGADVNAKGRFYETALTAAARGGYKEVVQQLLAEGADVNAKGRKYGTALAAAAKGGHKEVVQQLLAEGADINAEGGFYGTALAAAAGEGHKEVVQQLLAEGADVNAEGGEYGTALAAAAEGGHKEVVQQLLAEGADVNAKGGKYGTALAAAAIRGHKEVIQQLLGKGADDRESEH